MYIGISPYHTLYSSFHYQAYIGISPYHTLYSIFHYQAYIGISLYHTLYSSFHYQAYIGISPYHTLYSSFHYQAYIGISPYCTLYSSFYCNVWLIRDVSVWENTNVAHCSCDMGKITDVWLSRRLKAHTFTWNEFDMEESDTSPSQAVILHLLVVTVGGGPRVVVNTAAFHARVRGSVPGLGGLKETKNVSSPSTCECQY